MEITTLPKINSIQIEGDLLIIQSEEKVYKWRLADISKKLSQASETERDNFQISPSGYGVHWPQIDEDLSLHGLLRLVV
jgi:hypothetical protein